MLASPIRELWVIGHVSDPWKRRRNFKDLQCVKSRKNNCEQYYGPAITYRLGSEDFNSNIYLIPP